MPLDPMTSLLLATAVFLLCHVGLASTPLRGLLIGRLGPGPYRGLYALAAIGALLWMAIAYGGTPREALWASGPVLRSLPLLAMPFALLALVAGSWGANPTAMGQEPPINGADPAVGIIRITRHPSLCAIALWAAVHLLAKGDSASLVFFGGFLLLALVGPALIDRRKRKAHGVAWMGFAAVTSTVPFAAILAGRNRLVLGEIGWRRLGAALLLYVLLWLLHPLLFGVRPY